MIVYRLIKLLMNIDSMTLAMTFVSFNFNILNRVIELKIYKVTQILCLLNKMKLDL